MSTSRFHSIAFGIILVVGVLLYGRTLPYPFVFDDYIYLVGNPLVKDARSFAYNGDFRSFAGYSTRLGLDPDLSTNFILRPVTYLTFYANYALGGLNPRGFRAVNIAIHCANAMLVLLVLSHLLRASPKAVSVTRFSAGFISLAAALCFLVHPLQIESVTYIVQRFTSLATCFTLLTILAYLRANAAERKPVRLAWRCLSVAALVAGMLSKETVFAVPFLLVLLDWLVMGTPLKVAGKRTLPYFLCLPIIPIMILVTSWAQTNGGGTLSSAFCIASDIKDPHYQWSYALTQPSVLLSYLRLILVPRRLNLDYDYPLFTSLLQEQVWMSVAVIAGIVACSWLLYRQRPGDARSSLCLYSVVWYFLVLMPSSSVIPLPDRMAEHRCYLASIGALTALVCLVDVWRTSFVQLRWMRYIIPGSVMAWAVALSVSTWSRNEVWSSEIGIWRDTAAKSPHKFRPWINLGTAYAEKGGLHDAALCFRSALRIEPRLIVGYENLAATENTLLHYQEALRISNVGLRCAPNSLKMNYNQGVALCGLGRIEEAAQSFNRAIKIQATHLPSQLALTLCYDRLHQYDRALEHARTAASLDPSNPQVLKILGEIELRTRQEQQASIAPPVTETGGGP